MTMTMNKSVLFVVALLAQQAAADHFGPSQCVEVARSAQGSCVLKTNCQNIDTSKLEFAFNCGNQDGTNTKHSFGKGGFDDVEEYDTEVKCVTCHAPSSVGQESAPPAVNFAAAAKKREPTKEEVNRVAKFGPDNCVSTYPSDTGTCILKTDCKDKALEKYVPGIVCADSQGEMVRHVFGEQSFKDKETFDTLIPCTQCLALDNFDSGKDTEEAVLKDEVETLKADMGSLTERVTKLEGGGAAKEEPKAEEAKAEEAKPEEKAFLAHKRQHTAGKVHHSAVRAATHKKKAVHKKKKASKKQRRVVEEEEDDQDDSDSDEQNDDDDQDTQEEDEDTTTDKADDEEREQEQEEDDEVKPDDV